MNFTQCILPLVQVPHGDNVVVVVVVNDKELHFGIKLTKQQSDREAKKKKERKTMIIKSKKNNNNKTQRWLWAGLSSRWAGTSRQR